MTTKTFVSAVDAVGLLGNYVDEAGASEVNGVLLGDCDETWYFEIGSAHHWIAVRVPDDSYLVVANGMRVCGVDLDSPDVRCSTGLRPALQVIVVSREATSRAPVGPSTRR